MSTFIELLKLAAERPALRIDKNSDGSFTVEGNGDRNIVKTVKDAYDTIDDDPGNHKKKGLASLGGAVVAAGAGAYAASKLPHPVSAPSPNPVAAIAIPAGTYYALNNLDRKNEAVKGLAAAGTGLYIANRGASQATGPVLSNSQRAVAGAAVLAPTALATYGVHELRKAEAIQRERQANNCATQPSEGVESLYINKNKDVEDRYPLLSLALWKDKVKKWLS